MSDSSSPAWPSIIAVVGIVVGALGAGFAAWVNSNAQARIAEVQAQAKLAEVKANHTWDIRVNQCQQLSTIAEDLAQSRASLFSNFDLKSRATMEGYIWAGASYLTSEEQKPFLARYQEGPHKSDQDGFEFVNELSSIVLKQLAQQAALCRQGLSEIKVAAKTP